MMAKMKLARHLKPGDRTKSFEVLQVRQTVDDMFLAAVLYPEDNSIAVRCWKDPDAYVQVMPEDIIVNACGE